MQKLTFVKGLCSAAFAGAAAFAATPAAAAFISWTDWTAATTGYPGSASGTAGAVGVSYGGEVQGPGITVLGSGPNSVGFGSPWAPASTFADGSTVANAPISGNMIGLMGGGGPSAITNTITFSQAVLNPVMAIFSLGGGSLARFDFIGSTPYVVTGGLATPCCGGSTITSSGSSILGTEGNGTIQFLGTYTSISWKNPLFENYYAFTVGHSVSEPVSLALLGLGLLGIGLGRRRIGR